MALRFLKFSQAEKDYLSLLHSYQRSGLAERRRKMKAELEDLRQASLRADEHLETDKNQGSGLQGYEDYYLDPMVQLVHMFLTVKHYEKNYSEVAKLLNLTEDKWNDILNKLINLRLIEVHKNKIVVLQEHLMLSNDSPLVSAYHINLKSLATSKLFSVPNKKKNSISTLFTCSKDTAEMIRFNLIEFLKSTEKLVTSDENPSEVYQISLDLFPWN